jgi:hypothetical protein
VFFSRWCNFNLTYLTFKGLKKNNLQNNLFQVYEEAEEPTPEEIPEEPPSIEEEEIVEEEEEEEEVLPPRGTATLMSWTSQNLGAQNCLALIFSHILSC